MSTEFLNNVVSSSSTTTIDIEEEEEEERRISVDVSLKQASILSNRGHIIPSTPKQEKDDLAAGVDGVARALPRAQRLHRVESR